MGGGLESRVNYDGIVFVLIHSPLVGPLTWSRVAEEMRGRGLEVAVPTLEDLPDSKEPFSMQHTKSVSLSLGNISTESPVVLVAHSGAGPLLPVIRDAIPNSVHAYVFVDAGLSRNAAPRLELMQSEDSSWAKEFQEYLEAGGRFPNWSADDLGEIIPDLELREQMVAEINPRGLDFFTEPIPVFTGWPDAPCVYILFSEPYRRAEAEARLAGWKTYVLEAGHFHMLVDGEAVTELILDLLQDVSAKTP